MLIARNIAMVMLVADQVMARRRHCLFFTGCIRTRSWIAATDIAMGSWSMPIMMACTAKISIVSCNWIDATIIAIRPWLLPIKI